MQMVSVLFPQNMDGHPDQVAGLNLVSCSILWQVYTPMVGAIQEYSSYCTLMGIFCQSSQDRSVILRLRAVLLGHSRVYLTVWSSYMSYNNPLTSLRDFGHMVGGVLVTPQVSNGRFTHRHGFMIEVVADRTAFLLQSGFGLGQVSHLGLIVTKDIG